MRKRVYRVCGVAGILLALGGLMLAGYWHALSKPRYDYFRERPGHLLEQRLDGNGPVNGEVVEDLILHSDTGLVVDARIRRPATAPGETLPVIVIIGGHRTGRHATDLVEDLSGIAYAAIDYPYRGSADVSGVVDALRLVPAVQRAFLDTPPALVLLLRWLRDQPWADRRQIELAGVSLGVPFAAAAGGQDTGFSRVWLVHGGLDNRGWVDYALRRHIDSDALRNVVSGVLLHLVNGASFDTLDWIRRTAPRPVIAITAIDDERVPIAARRALEEAAADRLVELVVTEGRHVDPGRERELTQLLDIVKQRVLETAAANR